ncbi:SRPBCC family protein [Dongia rigui]|uniref:Carbon monoxide dehydrogenase subunit G n=1 Tax=Dongia rigui TaxID=940149 RepID=A0ABU5DTT3_9PROT|nr:carbon monoxide dehydrogenase subunit G [Dongia rigui]MDY0870715.1 carbon monoxide dehydrogenase subunit G [Dongia rigui]
MDISGEYPIPAPRAVVWAALNDPDILKSVIAGCEELVRDGDGFTATVVAKVGPVKAKFGGRITLSDIDPPNGYTITGEGQGGAAGFAKGGAKVNLSDDGQGGTILKYTADAQIGGKLAQIGSRLIEGTAKKMADDFFSAFAAAVSAHPSNDAAAAAPSLEAQGAAAPGVEAVAASEAAAAAAAPIATPAPAPAKSLHPAIWISGLVAVVGGVLYLFARR